MTQQLIELLTTLVARPNVQEVVRQGIAPLLTTVSSYMIIAHSKEKAHLFDSCHFIHEKDEDVFKLRSIRNSCTDLVSSLIEVFGDDCVRAVLYIVENLLLSTQAY